MWIGFRVILTFTFVWLAPELGRTDNHQVALGLDGGHPAIARVLAGIRRAYGTLKKPEIRTGGGAWRVRRARGSRPVAFIMSANLARRHMTTKSP